MAWVWFNCCVRLGNNPIEEPQVIERDAERSAQRTRTINKGEKSKITFNEVRQFAWLTSSRHERERFIDSTIKYKFFLAYNLWGLYPLYLKQESLRVLENHNWIRLQIRNEVWIRKGEQIRLSVDWVGWPTLSFNQLVGRSSPTETQWVPVGRPLWLTVLLVTVDRVVDRAAPVHVVHAGRSDGRPLSWPAANSVLASSELRSLCYLFQWV